jgi:hypothetical protein
MSIFYQITSPNPLKYVIKDIKCNWNNYKKIRPGKSQGAWMGLGVIVEEITKILF